MRTGPTTNTRVGGDRHLLWLRRGGYARSQFIRFIPSSPHVWCQRSAEQEPLVQLLALVAIPGAPLVARELAAAGQRFEDAKRIVEVRGRLFGVHPDQEAGPCRREVIS